MRLSWWMQGHAGDLRMVGAAMLGVCLSVRGWERSSIEFVCMDTCSFRAMGSWKRNRWCGVSGGLGNREIGVVGPLGGSESRGVPWGRVCVCWCLPVPGGGMAGLRGCALSVLRTHQQRISPARRFPLIRRLILGQAARRRAGVGAGVTSRSLLVSPPDTRITCLFWPKKIQPNSNAVLLNNHNTR